jgi:hypothetical protein
LTGEAKRRTCKLQLSTQARFRRKGAALDQTSVSTDSSDDADDLGISGEPAKRLLGAGYAVVDADLKDAPTGPQECHLRIWSDLADEVRRLTGARFIVSLAAVLDFDAHRLRSFVCEAVEVAQAPTPVSPGIARR